MKEPLNKKAAERFWSKTKQEGDCLVWTSTCDAKGYGRIHFEGRGQAAHRVAYKLKVGEIPKGLLVCHKCDNPPCVKPEHLFLGTHQENANDMKAKGRAAVGAKNSQARFGEEVAREIQRLYDGGTPIADIARRFKMPTTSCREVCIGHSWGYLRVPSPQSRTEKDEAAEKDWFDDVTSRLARIEGQLNINERKGKAADKHCKICCIRPCICGSFIGCAHGYNRGVGCQKCQPHQAESDHDYVTCQDGECRSTFTEERGFPDGCLCSCHVPKKECTSHGPYEGERCPVGMKCDPYTTCLDRDPAPKPESTEVRELIEDLVDEGKCWYDHHGYCQEHGWMETDPACPHARAKDYLSRDD